MDIRRWRGVLCDVLKLQRDWANWKYSRRGKDTMEYAQEVKQGEAMNKIFIINDEVPPERWQDAPSFFIFMMGLLSGRPPYDQMTPEEIYDVIRSQFIEAQKIKP